MAHVYDHRPELAPASLAGSPSGGGGLAIQAPDILGNKKPVARQPGAYPSYANEAEASKNVRLPLTSRERKFNAPGRGIIRSGGKGQGIKGATGITSKDVPTRARPDVPLKSGPFVKGSEHSIGGAIYTVQDDGSLKKTGLPGGLRVGPNRDITDKDRANMEGRRQAAEDRKAGLRHIWDPKTGTMDTSKHDNRAEAARIKKVRTQQVIADRMAGRRVSEKTMTGVAGGPTEAVSSQPIQLSAPPESLPSGTYREGEQYIGPDGGELIFSGGEMKPMPQAPMSPEQAKAQAASNREYRAQKNFEAAREARSRKLAESGAIDTTSQQAARQKLYAGIGRMDAMIEPMTEAYIENWQELYEADIFTAEGTVSEDASVDLANLLAEHERIGALIKERALLLDEINKLDKEVMSTADPDRANGQATREAWDARGQAKPAGAAPAPTSGTPEPAARPAPTSSEYVFSGAADRWLTKDEWEIVVASEGLEKAMRVFEVTEVP